MQNIAILAATDAGDGEGWAALAVVGIGAALLFGGWNWVLRPLIHGYPMFTRPPRKTRR